MALAAALAQETPLLLLDEPTAHLDVPHQLAVCALLRGLGERAVLLSLHDVNLALRSCTHALLFTPGGIVQGLLHDVLTPERIAQAYGCAMRPVVVDGRSYFLPA